MTSERKPKTTAVTPKAVAEYLRRTPDFFRRHPEALRDLEFPTGMAEHTVGGVTSLLGYQAGVLREENRELKQKLQTLMDNMRHNEQVMRRLNILFSRLLRMGKLNPMLEHLYATLLEDFELDAVRCGIELRNGATPADTDQALYIPREQLYRMFGELLADGEPVACALESAQVRYLFGEQHAALASFALLPLRGTDWSGLLCMASGDAQRFPPGTGMELLSHFGELFATLLDLRLPRAGAAS